MIPFLAGFAVPYLALYAWGLAAAATWFREDPSMQRVFILVTVVIPIACGWGAAELVNLIRPRHLLDRRLKGRTLTRLLIGMIAGVIGAFATAVLLPLVDRFVPDAVLTGSAGVIAAGFIVLLLPRVRPGHCIHCGYDLRSGPGPGRPGAGLCPECGAAAIPQRRYAHAA